MHAIEARTTTDKLVGALVGGRYRVLERLGVGAMGTVYAVAHLAMERRFAMKVVHRQLTADAELIARFRREALAGGRLAHPNCVAVHDFGALADGELYLVMDLVRGRSLGDLLFEEGRVPWARALRIMRHVLRGLGHAHAHGVVHRDIKPENLFVEGRDDDQDFTRLLDFGIAKLVGHDVPSLTQEGMTLGTPEYLAPEQALAGHIDGRTDLYAVSIVLYEMLVGRTPFGDLDELSMLTAHTSARVPRFAEVAPGIEIPPPGRGAGPPRPRQATVASNRLGRRVHRADRSAPVRHARACTHTPRRRGHGRRVRHHPLAAHGLACRHRRRRTRDSHRVRVAPERAGTRCAHGGPRPRQDLCGTQGCRGRAPPAGRQASDPGVAARTSSVGYERMPRGGSRGCDRGARGAS